MSRADAAAGLRPAGTVALMPAVQQAALAERTIDVGATLGWFRHGASDPTTWLRRFGRGAGGEFVRASLTPDGPGTARLRWSGRLGRDLTGLDVETWGAGGDWLRGRVPSMVGADDPGAPELEEAPDHVVARSAREHRSRRIGSSGDLYHELLPTIIEQRITTGEAKRQWAGVCTDLGAVAPGPFAGLRLPPDPEVLARQPSWWFHPRGVERKRAEPLILIARHASKLRAWSQLPPAAAAERLRPLRGIGRWTIGSVLGPALGDPDAVPVGDFHIKHMVGWALAGEPRATDDRMLELLEPYAGQRGRVVALIKLAGLGAPKYGPRRRVLPMHAW